jgi:chromosome segregation ATPase
MSECPSQIHHLILSRLLVLDLRERVAELTSQVSASASQLELRLEPFAAQLQQNRIALEERFVVSLPDASAGTEGLRHQIEHMRREVAQWQEDLNGRVGSLCADLESRFGAPGSSIASQQGALDELQRQIDEQPAALDTPRDQASGLNSSDVNLDEFKAQLEGLHGQVDAAMEHVDACRSEAERVRDARARQVQDSDRKVEDLESRFETRLERIDQAAAPAGDPNAAMNLHASPPGDPVPEALHDHVEKMSTKFGDVLQRVETRIEPAIADLESRRHEAEAAVGRIESQFQDLQVQLRASLARSTIVSSTPSWPRRQHLPHQRARPPRKMVNRLKSWNCGCLIR